MSRKASAFQQARWAYEPKVPAVLRAVTIGIEESPATHTDAAHDDEIKGLFPNTFNKPLVRLVENGGPGLSNSPLTVGVVLSGGPAPGGHNCIAGLFEALQTANPSSRLLGFIGGPKGVIDGHFKEITAELVHEYRNTGGFDMIGSGRDKIESAADLQKSKESLTYHGVQSLVVIGGDDSNTNAAILAEFFVAENAGIQVIGLPKTIDGDMKNEIIESSFGFDTAAKTYSNLVANVARDAMSSRKYTHFIKLMGRAASHVALEVALQVQPNITLISEEVRAKGLRLGDVVEDIVDMVVKRSEAGRSYGIVVVPEGLLEFLADFESLLKDLGHIHKTEEDVLQSFDTDEARRQFVNSKLPAESAKIYSSLPDDIQHVLLRLDKHGNIPVSQLQTEALLIDLVKLRIRELKRMGNFNGSFEPLAHFFGYEGRCVAPSNFDADYCYALGMAAAHLVRAGLTGYTVFASNMSESADQWVMGGVPVTSMLNMELRKGKMKPVIKKALVDLEGAPFRRFAENRANWKYTDNFLFAGPIQYYGPGEVCDALTATLSLEREVVPA
ncbi:MAG: diphosphate--fructose-6-phosphate 1-phosphotransferase [Candidatus Sumerlaeaceae bacterium]